MLLALSLQVVNASEKSSRTIIQFTGQEQESIQLNNELTETRYRTEYRDTTCTRQVPYEEQVCETIPDYDTVCRTIPGRNDCRTEYDRQCRTVTRYRQECSRGPSRRECTNENRRVCRQVPGRRQCRTLPNGTERCRDLPGHRVCENKPERVCRNVPGERTCRQVPYTERECNRVPRQVCEWIPSRQDCRTEQTGSHQECRMETRYRTETYACQEEVQVPYTVTLATYNLNGTMSFTSEQGYAPQFALETSLTTGGETRFTLGESNGFKPMAWLTKDEQRSGNDNIQITGTYALHIKNAEVVRSAVRSITNIKLDTKKMSFVMNAQSDVKGYDIFLTLKDGENKLISRKLTKGEFKVVEREGKLIHVVAMAGLGIELKKLHKYTYKLGTAPVFKMPVAFPSMKAFRAKKEGTVYTFTDADLNELRTNLDRVRLNFLSTELLTFNFPNHKLVSDVVISIKVSDFSKTLSKDEFEMNVSEQDVAVSVDIEKLGVELGNIFGDNPVTVDVKYIFDQEAPLPGDFAFTASKADNMPTLLGDRIVNEAREATQYIQDLRLKKYSFDFKLKKSALLKDFTFKLKVWKRSKVKFERELSSSDVKVTDAEGDLMNVHVNFKKYGAKVSKLGKHQVALSVEHIPHDELNSRGVDLGDLTSGTTREMEAK